MARHGSHSNGNKPLHQPTDDHKTDNRTKDGEQASAKRVVTGRPSTNQTKTGQTSADQAKTGDPFRDAVEQGIQDGIERVNKHTKNVFTYSIAAVAAIVVICIIVFGVMSVQTSQKMREMNEINTCRNTVTALNASYSNAFQLKGKVVDAFSSMDSSYDLEKLSKVYNEEVKAPASFDCKANPSATAKKAKTARAAYDKQAKKFKQALKQYGTKQDENQSAETE